MAPIGPLKTEQNQPIGLHRGTVRSRYKKQLIRLNMKKK